MDKQIFDLTAKCRREFLILGVKLGAMAYKAGLISGLNFGLARLKVTEETPDWKMVHTLGSNDLDVDQAIEKVNKLMPVGKFCDATMFYLPESRTNPQFERGFIDGFFYVYNLHDVFRDLFAGDKRDLRFAETKKIVEARKNEIVQF